MKGVSYLVDDSGKKTHVVLDLTVWQATWQALVKQQAVRQSRKLGSLKKAFETAGFEVGQVGDTLLEPMSEEELALWYDGPIFPDEAPS